MNVVTKLGAALTVVFVVSLVFLVVQILYVLWRRRRFQQGGLTSAGDGHGEFNGEPICATQTQSSKELLYFFCWQNYQANRIEPDTVASEAVVPPLPAASPTDAEVEEMLKLHELYGPSRVLFTIKEEEREEREEMENENMSFAENVVAEKKKGTGVGFEDAAVLSAAAAVVVQVVDVEVTPFTTPCDSPPYYTPSPSPTHEGPSTSASENEEDGVVSETEDKQTAPQETITGQFSEKTASFISIDVHTP